MKNLIIAGILAIFATTTISAEDFDYAEVNTFVSKGNWTIGAREYQDKDYSQRILRYNFAKSPYSVEYRSVDNAGLREDRFRLQVKQIKQGPFFFNSRFEHRSREGKENVFRYRPQFGIEAQGQPNLLFGRPFVILEPHVQWTYNGDKIEYSHMQTFIGTKYVFGNFEVSPMIEIDLKDDFSKDVAYFAIDFKIKL